MNLFYKIYVTNDNTDFKEFEIGNNEEKMTLIPYEIELSGSAKIKTEIGTIEFIKDNITLDEHYPVLYDVFINRSDHVAITFVHISDFNKDLTEKDFFKKIISLTNFAHDDYIVKIRQINKISFYIDILPKDHKRILLPFVCLVPKKSIEEADFLKKCGYEMTEEGEAIAGLLHENPYFMINKKHDTSFQFLKNDVSEITITFIEGAKDRAVVYLGEMVNDEKIVARIFEELINKVSFFHENESYSASIEINVMGTRIVIQKEISEDSII